MKIRRTGRRIAAVLLTLSMVLSLAACGGKSGANGNGGSPGEGAASEMPKITIRDGVARAQQVEISAEDYSADSLQLLGVEEDWLYGLYYNYDSEETEAAGNDLIRFKKDGGSLEKIPFKDMTPGAEVVASAFRDGCFYLGLVSYQNSEALEYALANEGSTEEAAIPDDLSEDGTSTFELFCVGTDGSLKWKSAMDSATGDEYYYINSIAVLDDGVYVVSSTGVDRYDRESGAFSENVCTVKEEDLTGTLYVLADGTVIMTDDYSMTAKVSSYDPAQKKFVEKCVFPSALQGSALFAGKSYDFYLAGDDGIYGAKLGSNEVTPVVNFVNSDLDAQGVVRMIELEDGRIALQSYGADTSLEIYLLEPVAPEDVEEKTELTLGGYYIDFDVRSEVIRFNKENEKYRISLVDYSQFDLESDDYYESSGINQLNTDLASGSAPDIILLSESIPVDNYISKGVFEDLTDRYNADKEIDKSDFLKNVTDAFLTDGKMYLAVPGFSITGVSGKTKYIGDGKNLSFDKIRKIAADKGLDNSAVFGLTDRDTVFHSAIAFSGDQFIDRNAHTCNFNTDEFRELLEFVKLFPEAINEEQYNDYYTQYLADKALLNIQYINTVYDYNYMTRDLFGDMDVTLTGFPSAVNRGPAVEAALQMGINSSASDPDGCWQFVRRFYLPDFQMKMEGSLPVSEEAIDAQGQELIESLKEQREEYNKYLEELNQSNGTDTPEAAEGTTSEEAAADSTGAQAAAEEEEIVEPVDMSKTPMPEKDFNGTHEEYEEYVKQFEQELAESGGTLEAVVLGDEPYAPDENGASFSTADLPDFDEKDMAKFKEILKGLSYATNDNSDVWNIISEEAGAYFAGQKSAEEISDIIQSRVQVYLKENE